MAKNIIQSFVSARHFAVQITALGVRDQSLSSMLRKLVSCLALERIIADPRNATSPPPP